MASKNKNNDHGDEDDDVRHMNDTTMPPPKTAIRKVPASNPRQKFGLRKGFGLQDWVVLTKNAKDLAQRKGAPLRNNITKEELRQHNQLHDGWCSLKGKVYNIAPYLAYHPGGEAILKKVLGKDASLLFDKYHPWVNIEGLIGTLQLGYLDTNGNTATEDHEGSKPAYMAETKQQDECECRFEKTSAHLFWRMGCLLNYALCCCSRHSSPRYNQDKSQGHEQCTDRTTKTR
jgi:cytochrome b involved in lipid metabolism